MQHAASARPVKAPRLEALNCYPMLHAQCTPLRVHLRSALTIADRLPSNRPFSTVEARSCVFRPVTVFRAPHPDISAYGSTDARLWTYRSPVRAAHGGRGIRGSEQRRGARTSAVLRLASAPPSWPLVASGLRCDRTSWLGVTQRRQRVPKHHSAIHVKSMNSVLADAAACPTARGP